MSAKKSLHELEEATGRRAVTQKHRSGLLRRANDILDDIESQEREKLHEAPVEEHHEEPATSGAKE